jgi:CHU_C Type IX secretion signal domain
MGQKKKILLFIFFICGVFQYTQAVVLSPQPRCISVLTNGNVSITWSTPADPSLQFSSYKIYRAAAIGGPYTLITSVAVYLQTTFTDATVNANGASFFYYIQTEYNSGGLNVSAPLDTLQSIRINVVNPLNGTAVLNWNPISITPIASTTLPYKVYREFPATVWTLIGTTSATNFKDTILVCNRIVNYKVEIPDNTGCSSVSSIGGGLFQNLIVPSIPSIDTLSVNNANNALLNWNTNSAPDAVAYVIYQLSGGVWVAVDTVFGINNTAFTYTASSAGTGSESYRVAALDSCSNISPMGNIQSSLYLSTSANICQRTATLTWNAYTGFVGGVSAYNIYHSVTSSSGPYLFIGTVSGSTLAFTSGSLVPLITNYFKVVAVDGNGKSVSSNRKSLITPLPIPPLYTIMRSASIMAENRVDIIGEVDIAASTLGYKLMYSNNGEATNFTEIANRGASASSTILFNNYSNNTTQGSLYFKLVTIDSCQNNGQESVVHKTIFLSAQANDNNTNTLNWNNYRGWPGGVTQYNVYRRMSNGQFNGLVGTTTDTSFIDDLDLDNKGDGKFLYVVEAIENGGFGSYSLSNEAVALQNEAFYVPNAFAPDGHNTEFKPKAIYLAFTGYSLEIYNRWGQLIFKTTDYNQGWDGNNAEGGVYSYVIRYKNSKDESKLRRGSVVLIR